MTLSARTGAPRRTASVHTTGLAVLDLQEATFPGSGTLVLQTPVAGKSQPVNLGACSTWDEAAGAPGAIEAWAGLHRIERFGLMGFPGVDNEAVTTAEALAFEIYHATPGEPSDAWRDFIEIVANRVETPARASTADDARESYDDQAGLLVLPRPKRRVLFRASQEIPRSGLPKRPARIVFSTASQEDEE